MKQLGDHRLIHLDLKTCPLKFSFIQKLFPFFKELGATGVLVEWEDTFPYNDELSEIGSLNTSKSYTEYEVTEILKLGSYNNLEIISLVQTFGHLEFVLKHSKWIHLREVPRYCSSICPSHSETLPLIKKIIQQIMKLHCNAKFIHLGGDEVWHMGICKLCCCKERQHLYLQHMSEVLKYVHQNYPGVEAIIWDDMLRTIDIDKLKESGIGNYVEPMIWNYQTADMFNITDDLFDKYSAVFRKIWIASAYKGATGSCQILPIISCHISNHEKWLNVMSVNADKFTVFRGIALTGWSRYDHYAVLCELLPSAVVSLALCLKIWISGKYDKSIFKHVASVLGYDEETPMLLDRPQIITKTLNFPGQEIYKAIEWFYLVRSRFNNVAYSDSAVTWMNSWHLKRNYVSLMHVERILLEFKCFHDELVNVESYLRKSMTEAYSDDTIDEWIGTYMEPLTNKLKELIRDAQHHILQ